LGRESRKVKKRRGKGRVIDMRNSGKKKGLKKEDRRGRKGRISGARLADTGSAWGGNGSPSKRKKGERKTLK